MIIKRFYDEGLAQTSYLIGCAATGEALVVDPNRDAEQYVAAAEAEGLRITHVTETHIHADFVSGSRELAARTGARMYLSAEGGAEWAYSFAESDHAVLLHDSDTFKVGNILLQAVHTPGHTPEHLSFLVTDTAAADRPIAIMTGDFVFVGDVGRPDLLERAAGHHGTMEASARTLFRSLQKFKTYPDYIQVLPGHGAGSACGKGISSIPNSTVGYERRFNWALSILDEDAFVQAVLSGQPEPPRYFAQMKRINREGPRVLGPIRVPVILGHGMLEEALAAGSPVIDTRSTEAYAAGFVQGTINIPFNRSFTSWAGWLIPYDTDFYVILDEDPGVAQAVVKDLAMIGLDRIAGICSTDAIAEWAKTHVLQSLPHVAAEDLAARLATGTQIVIDVRGRTEWEAGHLPGVPNIPLGYLLEQLTDVPRDTPLVVHCQAGARSAIAASLLRANGFTDVTNLTGGYAAWVAGGLPTT